MDEQFRSPPEGPPTAPEGPSTPLTPEEKDARMWAMFCHLAGLAGYTGIPFANIIAPLVVWQIKKNDYAFVDDQGKEAVNFQISITLYILVSLLLVFCVVGIPILIALAIADVVLLIIAAIKANNGETYRYPLTIRLIK